MKWVGQAVVYLGLYIIWSGTFGQEDSRIRGIDWSIAIPSMLFGILILLAGAGLTTAAMKREQEEVDAATKSRFGAGGSGNGTSFSLFLRPFDVMGKFAIERPPANLFAWEQYDRPGLDALERVLADALKPTAPLEGLDGRGDVDFGPGTAGVVSDWKASIEAAMKQAAYIFVVPSANKGTLWEIGEIKSRDYVNKAVFVMPPTVYPFKFVGIGRYEILWEAAREACAREHRIDIPTYKPEGCLFLIDGARSIREVAFRGIEPEKVAKTINELMQA